MKTREALIIAGGLGTRLRSVVSDVPKPLAQVAGRPFLHWQIDWLAAQGIDRVIIATGYMGGLVREAVGSKFSGMDIVYKDEETPLGTGGAVWEALDICAGEHVFVLNGDTWFSVSLPLLASESTNADVVIATRFVHDRNRYGCLKLIGNRVVGMEKAGSAGPGLVNGGVYLFRRDVILRRPMKGSFSLEQEIFSSPGALDIRVHETSANFLDIGTPDDYQLAQELIPQWVRT